jgi:hypothetical protein
LPGTILKKQNVQTVAWVLLVVFSQIYEAWEQKEGDHKDLENS